MTEDKSVPDNQNQSNRPDAMDTDPLLEKGMPYAPVINNLTLRFQFKSSEVASANTRGHLATMTTTIINKLLSFSDLEITILDKKGHRVDRQSIIAISDELMQKKFQFKYRENAFLCPQGTPQRGNYVWKVFVVKSGNTSSV